MRINESVMLDIADWYSDLGGFGKLHVRFGKGSVGGGPKVRLVPGIDGVDVLLALWLTEIRPRFGDDLQAPGEPMFPSVLHPCSPGPRPAAWLLRADILVRRHRNRSRWLCRGCS
ncbi:hypothetical protein [Streptomyces pseudovenezuelae]|uniref:Uncharacterized protein n=1 Tax=Streptomyces pseudovenezuelae TaxID=67350 RepID=A0ABT6M2W1_9ACTN|nr:hypothetical protein [Streptomyces pseudovenezuelae]MDH6222460.1 hypothetical protein [Streptomyces pseudovenezuelae]